MTVARTEVLSPSFLIDATGVGPARRTLAPHPRQRTWATPAGAPGGLVSLASLLGTLGTPTTVRSACGVQ
jgi:hypothetical protein